MGPGLQPRPKGGTIHHVSYCDSATRQGAAVRGGQGTTPTEERGTNTTGEATHTHAPGADRSGRGKREKGRRSPRQPSARQDRQHRGGKHKATRQDTPHPRPPRQPNPRRETNATHTHTHTHKRFTTGRHYRRFLIESFSWIPRNR